MCALCAAQIRRTVFFDALKRVETLVDGSVNVRRPAHVGRPRTFSTELELRIVAHCEELSKSYRHIDKSMIIIVAAQCITTSDMADDAKEVAILRVRKPCAQCAYAGRAVWRP